MADRTQALQSMCCARSPSLLPWPPARLLAVHKYRDPLHSLPLPSPSFSCSLQAGTCRCHECRCCWSSIAADVPLPPMFLCSGRQHLRPLRCAPPPPPQQLTSPPLPLPYCRCRSPPRHAARTRVQLAVPLARHGHGQARPAPLRRCKLSLAEPGRPQPCSAPCLCRRGCEGLQTRIRRRWRI